MKTGKELVLVAYPVIDSHTQVKKAFYAYEQAFDTAVQEYLNQIRQRDDRIIELEVALAALVEERP